MDVQAYLQAQPTPGAARATLAQIAAATGAAMPMLSELVGAGVLIGSDAGGAPFTWAASHGRSEGSPVLLVPDDGEACWYCPSMVVGEYIRRQQAEIALNRIKAMKQRNGFESPRLDLGDAKPSNANAAPSADTSARVCLEMRKAGVRGSIPTHPSLLAAIVEGGTPEMFAEAARDAARLGKGFIWAVATVRARLEGAKRSTSRARAFGDGHAR
ncbi:TPA: hypothetical protein UMF67_001782 [Stenotrophomonas maltophilia]|nr:hypothetical protein [Stenotrophomonas maltophilia]